MTLLYLFSYLKQRDDFHILHVPYSSFSLGTDNKDLPQQTEVAQGVPGRLKPRIFLTLGTTRMVGL